MAEKRKGLTYGKRKQDMSTANQWAGTPQQEKFLLLYLDPKSPSFANAYESAMEAGYSDDYARIIAMPSVNNLWIQQARNLIKMGPEHLSQALSSEALSPLNKASDRIRALELIGKMQGVFIDKKIVAHVNIEEALRELK